MRRLVWMACWFLFSPGWGAELDPLTGWLTGSFSTRQQAESDERFAAVELHSREIWHGEESDRWIYLEQTLQQKAAHPFRQRIFRLRAGSFGEVRMTEYTMPKASDFRGAWRNPALLANLSEAQLSRREGCDIVLRRLPTGDYEGRNRVGECRTDFAGADTLVQYLWVGPLYLRMLDRGYDQDGMLRWGSPGEGYYYQRQ